MEGLIPLIYKSLKKNKTRRRYECLSSGSAQTYNIEDFYTKDDNDAGCLSRDKYLVPDGDGVPGLHGTRHRRYNSIHVDHVSSFARKEDEYMPKQLVRFRSHKLLSCVTGS